MGIYVEVAISLMMVFLILSLVVTAINELIAIQLRKRPKMLLQTIVQLIDNDELRARFYANGHISSGGEASQAGRTDEHPARVSIRNNAFPGPEAASAAYLDGHPSYISGKNFSKALSQALSVMDKTGANDPFGQIRGALGNLPDSRIRDVLAEAVDDARGDLEAFQAGLGDWYDSMQERLTGAYARYMKAVSLIVALVLAVILNVDSVRLAEELQVNNALRTEMADLADTAVADGLKACADDKDEACLIRQVQDNLDRANPAFFGWTPEDAWFRQARLLPWREAVSAAEMPGTTKTVEEWNGPGEFARLTLLKVVGLIVTVCAVSLGAPFWFDLLSTFVNIRGAGPKPDAKPA